MPKEKKLTLFVLYELALALILLFILKDIFSSFTNTALIGVTLKSIALIVIGMILWCMIRGIFIFINKSKYENFSISREVLLGLFIIYILWLIGVKLFPLEISWGGTQIKMKPEVNIIPFVDSIKGISQGPFTLKILLRNILGNIILLMPLGIFLPTFLDKFRSFKYCVLFGFLTSLTFEVLQFVENSLGIAFGRVSDIDDIILNTLGIVIGYILFNKLPVRAMRNNRIREI